MNCLSVSIVCHVFAKAPLLSDAKQAGVMVMGGRAGGGWKLTRVNIRLLWHRMWQHKQLQPSLSDVVTEVTPVTKPQHKHDQFSSV